MIGTHTDIFRSNTAHATEAQLSSACSVRRNCDGGIPACLLNARENPEASLYPTSSAISVSVIALASIRLRAREIRTDSSKSR